MYRTVNIDNVRARLQTEDGIVFTKLEDTPHYKLLHGDINPYIEYLEKYEQPEHSFEVYKKLIKNFNVFKVGYIKCSIINNLFIINDGFHRSCILLFKGEKEINIFTNHVN